ncbi:MAG: carbohydrate ABC transporter permease [Bacillati bacterium ANGP1]|uniref:Carbohydrate ABC transporter permease n=1 Tax=Candidatus Segetimicrobium genomatis TaxID=2569760 RepID=A0A537JF38_9BACT|nr:MAG: carbohydrate ABC transporter permease [Terrabacteria group bacterium ANGP1]
MARRFGLLYWLGVLLVAAWGLVQLVPILWMISTSLKPLNQIFALPIQWIPRPPQWSNYPQAWNEFPFARYFVNSFIVSASVTVLNVFLAGLAGYSLSKYRYFGQRALFIAILSTLMLPIEVLMVPTFLIAKTFGWLNTYQGLVIPAVADAFGVFLMRQFMLGLPDSLVEAARIDGAGELGTYFRIVVPLIWPAVLTLAIFTWRETWDAFVWPFIIISEDSLRTVPIGLQRFQEQYVTTYNSVMAISTIAMIPLVLLFFFFQRAFIRGIALSGLKE